VAILVDTGVALSAADLDEPRHLACAEVMRAYHGELVMAAPVVAETVWMIEYCLGPAAESRFVRLVASGELEVAELALEDYRRCAELIDAYSDMGLGLVDASVVVIAEHLGTTTSATLNRRDFAVVRPRHVDTFELLP
jgi:predicted nucleic acid-binding protein